MATGNVSSKDFLQASLKIQQGDKKYPVISLVRSEPQLAAAISKLVTPRIKNLADVSGDKSQSNINTTEFEKISASVAQKNKDFESVLQLFPDTELAAQILISSIISPKDMTTTEIIYKNENDLIPSSVMAQLMLKVKEYETKNYKLADDLPTILREVLFENGSYIKAIIPESTVDEIINTNSKYKQTPQEAAIATETIKELFDSKGHIKSLGVLGDPYAQSVSTQASTGLFSKTALESLSAPFSSTEIPSFLTTTNDKGDRVSLEHFNTIVSDNPALFRLPKVMQVLRRNRLSKAYTNSNNNTYAFEAQTTLTTSSIRSLIYKDKNPGIKDFVRVKTTSEQNRHTIGKPLIMKIPPESCIPVYVPGNVQERVGYFVILDHEGHPINRKSNSSYFNDLQSKINNKSDMSSMLLSKASTVLGTSCTSLNQDQASRIYADIVERDLIERLKNGLYGATLELGKVQEIYRIMLARSFANQYTQIIFLPTELVEYFAYKYNDDGTGKSLLDDQRILNSLRAMILFARTMASIKNSVGRTEVKIKLDEKDPDPQKTIEETIHEVAKTRQNNFPLGINTPSDLVDWVQKAGMEYTFEGHPRIPDMNLEFNEKQSNHPMPDEKLDEDLRKRSIQGFGVSPEQVDNAFQPEFATSITSNNILTSKRVIQIQEQITPHLTGYYQKILKNDGDAIYICKSIIKKNIKEIGNFIINKSNEQDQTGNKAEFNENTDKEKFIDYIFESFVQTLEITLPKPSSITLQNQMEAFDAYSDALDKTLQAYISTDLINSDYAGDVSNNIEAVRNLIKAYYQRQWMVENNVLPELAEIVASTQNDESMINFVDIQKDHMAGLMKSAVMLLDKMKPFANAANKDIEKITNGEGVETASASTSDSSSSSSSDEGSSTNEGADGGEPGAEDTGASSDPGDSLDSGMDLNF